MDKEYQKMDGPLTHFRFDPSELSPMIGVGPSDGSTQTAQQAATDLKQIIAAKSQRERIEQLIDPMDRTGRFIDIIAIVGANNIQLILILYSNASDMGISEDPRWVYYAEVLQGIAFFLQWGCILEALLTRFLAARYRVLPKMNASLALLGLEIVFYLVSFQLIDYIVRSNMQTLTMGSSFIPPGSQTEVIVTYTTVLSDGKTTYGDAQMVMFWIDMGITGAFVIAFIVWGVWRWRVYREDAHHLKTQLSGLLGLKQGADQYDMQAAMNTGVLANLR
jgi:hypothetical protein